MTLADYLDALQKHEPNVHAWSYHNPQEALLASQNVNSGALAGIPIGVKDIIDTIDMPTSYGSQAYAGHRPERDAWVVSRLKSCGAVIMGKTVTTEFAFTHAGPTRNPRNTAHTPGGSSSGSAAAVAAGMVPIALGSQTGGSTIRPSAYCGIIGLKPTFGLVSLQGVMPLAPSLDTIGIHAASVLLAKKAFEVLALQIVPGSSDPDRPVRVGWYPGAKADLAHTAAQKQLIAARDLLEKTKGFVVQDVRFADYHYTNLGNANRCIMTYEAAQMHQKVYKEQPEKLGASTTKLICDGLQLPDSLYEAALTDRISARCAFTDAMSDLDVLLTFSAPGEAPLFEDGTGSSVFNQPWTTLGCPCITIPFGIGEMGLPLGITLVAKHYEDAKLLNVALAVEKLISD